MRIGLVGCGRAAAQHVPAIHAAGGEIAAVHDQAPARAERLAAQAHAPVRDLDELLSDRTIDAIAICTPPDTHVELAVQVLAAGKGAVVEKPPALSRKGVEQLAAAGRRYGRPVAVMLQHRGRLPEAILGRRWSPATSATVEVFRYRPAEHYDDGTWRGDARRAGGGFFAHLAIHYVDLACQVLGEAEHVQAFVEPGTLPGIDVRSLFCVRTVAGALLTVHASALPQARSERLHVLDGSLELTITNAETRLREGEQVTAIPAAPTSELRAEVYRELRFSLAESRPLRRYAVEHAAAAVGLLEHVIESVAVVAT